MTDQPGYGAATRERPESDDRPIGEVFSAVTSDLSTLIRQEVALAKAELKRDVTAGVVGAAMFVVAGVFAFLAVILLLIAAAYGLVAAGLSPWLAFLVVAGALLLIGLLLALVGKSRLGKIGPPERTIRSSKETVAALKQRGSGPG